MSPNPFKTSAKQKRDRDRDSQPRPRPRLNSQPQGATKGPCKTSKRLAARKWTPYTKHLLRHKIALKSCMRPKMITHTSWRTKRDKLKKTKGAKFAVFSLIFADFCFSWELLHFGSAYFHRKPLDICRKKQKTPRCSQKPVCPI